jgi:hypothetical protein
MSWFQKAIDAAKATAISMFPALGVVDAARDYVSEAVAQKIKAEACAKAYELLAQTHRNVITTIVWQNALLFLSLIPVLLLHSPIPFYLAYTVVAGYSIYSVKKSWPMLERMVRTRSVTQTVSTEVLTAIQAELTQRQFYERKVVEWLGPDLRIIADDVAKKLKPDVVTALTNMAFTLLLAFVAFRLFAIPLLEHKALG